MDRKAGDRETERGQRKLLGVGGVTAGTVKALPSLQLSVPGTE